MADELEQPVEAAERPQRPRQKQSAEESRPSRKRPNQPEPSPGRRNPRRKRTEGGRRRSESRSGRRGEPRRPRRPKPAERQAEEEPVRKENFKWYIFHAYSGFERKVRESIQSRVQAFGLKDRVGKVMIPMEPVTEITTGKSGRWSAFSCPATCWWRWNWTTNVARAEGHAQGDGVPGHG